MLSSTVPLPTLVSLLRILATSARGQLSTATEGRNMPLWVMERIIRTYRQPGDELGLTNDTLQLLIEAPEKFGYGRESLRGRWLDDALRLAPFAARHIQGLLYHPCTQYGSVRQIAHLFEILGTAPSFEDLSRLAHKAASDKAAMAAVISLAQKHRPEHVAELVRTMEELTTALWTPGSPP